MIALVGNVILWVVIICAIQPLPIGRFLIAAVAVEGLVWLTAVTSKGWA